MKEALKGFTLLVIDDSGRNRSEDLGEWGIRGFPWLVFVDGQGEVTGELPGVQPAQKIIALAQRAAQ